MTQFTAELALLLFGIAIGAIGFGEFTRWKIRRVSRLRQQDVEALLVKFPRDASLSIDHAREDVRPRLRAMQDGR